MLSLHRPIPSDSMLTCKLFKCSTWAASRVRCWQGQNPLHIVPRFADEDNGKAIVALLDSHGADLKAQDSQVSPGNCTSVHQQ